MDFAAKFVESVLDMHPKCMQLHLITEKCTLSELCRQIMYAL